MYGVSENPKSRFDSKLKNTVIEFQNNNNIVADGIVGRQTLMPLVQQ
ncbi:peptidoglycan-binding domain-containing protein [Psychromonas arctica]